jgi:adenylyl-sulfate kinase
VTRNIVWHEGKVSRERRAEITGGPGVTVWMTGLSGSGKSTIARGVERALVDKGRAVYVLDGDNLRHGINSDLGFSQRDRTENVRRVGEIALLIADAGLVALVPVISPYRVDRDAVRHRHEALGVPFVEVFVDAPLEVCEMRDPKGLYARTRAGEFTGMTGIDDPYETPESPDLRIDTSHVLVDESVERVVKLVSRASGVSSGERE